VGVEYKGYLIAVRDKNGDILSLKCSKLDYEKNAKAIMAGDKGTTFDAEFTQVGQKSQEDNRKPNKQNKKPLPGRRF
jgi:hypothetical protein